MVINKILFYVCPMRMDESNSFITSVMIFDYSLDICNDDLINDT